MAANYEVKSVTEEQIPDPSGSEDFIDVFNITYTIPPKSDQFTIQIPESPDPVTAAYNAITAKATEILAIYAGSSG